MSMNIDSWMHNKKNGFIFSCQSNVAHDAYKYNVGIDPSFHANLIWHSNL
jgi:hypothetical protein